MTSLIGVDLSANLLDELPPGLFFKQSSLQFLNLTGNKLVELPFDIFSPMTNLSLNENMIEKIDARLFASLCSLNLLDLSLNKLTLQSIRIVVKFKTAPFGLQSISLI
jgi:Leucine-rich repeat (LRR) protein